MKFINKFYKKIGKTAYRKGYMIDFQLMEEKPDFHSYQLNKIGDWLKTAGDHWICTSTITDKSEFEEYFFDETKLERSKVRIEERYFPSLVGI